MVSPAPTVAGFGATDTDAAGAATMTHAYHVRPFTVAVTPYSPCASAVSNPVEETVVMSTGSLNTTTRLAFRGWSRFPRGGNVRTTSGARRSGTTRTRRTRLARPLTRISRFTVSPALAVTGTG